MKEKEELARQKEEAIQKEKMNSFKEYMHFSEYGMGMRYGRPTRPETERAIDRAFASGEEKRKGGVSTAASQHSSSASLTYASENVGHALASKARWAKG
tara:strand:- start:240 stop:536 length:297 start_codon:yes stop_codon:yes gene_type:complete